MTLYDRYRRFAINHPWQSMALWGVLLFLLTFSISRVFGDSFAESLATALLYGFGVFLFQRLHSLVNPVPRSGRRGGPTTLNDQAEAVVRFQWPQLYSLFAAAVLLSTFIIRARQGGASAVASFAPVLIVLPMALLTIWFTRRRVRRKRLPNFCRTFARLSAPDPILGDLRRRKNAESAVASPSERRLITRRSREPCALLPLACEA